MAASVEVELLTEIKDSIGQIKRFQKESVKSLSGVQKATRSLNSSFKSIAETAAGFLSAQVISAGFDRLVGGLRDSVQEAVELENALVGLKSVAAATGQDVGGIEDAAKRLAADGLIPLTEVSASLKNLLATGLDADQAVSLFESLRDAAAFNRSGQLSLAEAIRGATDGIKNQNSTLVDNAGVTKNLSIIYKEYAAQLGKTVGQLTEAEKTQAAFTGITKEAALFQGDYNRLLGTFSGSLSRVQGEFRFLLAEIGQLITQSPQAIDAVAGLGDLFQSLRNILRQNKGELQDFVGDAIDGIRSLAEKIVPALVTALEFLFEAVNKVQLAFARLKQATAFVTGFVAQLGQTEEAQREVTKAVQEDVLAIEQQIRTQRESLQERVELLNNVGGQIQEAIVNTNKQTSAIEKQTDAIEDQAQQAEELGSIIDQLGNAFSGFDFSALSGQLLKDLQAVVQQVFNPQILSAALSPLASGIAGFADVNADIDNITGNVDQILGDIEQSLRDEAKLREEQILRNAEAEQDLLDANFSAGLISAEELANQSTALQIKAENEIAKVKEDLAIQVERRIAEEREKIQKEIDKKELERAKKIEDSATGFVSNITSAVTDIFAPGFGGVAASLIQILGQAPDQIREFFRTVFQQVTEVIANIVENLDSIIIGLLEGVSNAITTLVERAPEIIDRLIEGLPEVASSLATNMPRVGIALAKAMPTVATEFAIELIKELPNIAGEFIKALITELPKLIFELGKSLFDTLGGIFEDIGKGLADLLGIDTGVDEGASADEQFEQEVQIQIIAEQIAAETGRPLDEIIAELRKTLFFLPAPVSDDGGGAGVTTGPDNPGTIGDPGIDDPGIIIEDPLGLRVAQFQSGGMASGNSLKDNILGLFNAKEVVLDPELTDRLDAFLDRQSPDGDSGERQISVTLNVGESQLANVLLNLDRQGFRTAS